MQACQLGGVPLTKEPLSSQVMRQALVSKFLPWPTHLKFPWSAPDYSWAAVKPRDVMWCSWVCGWVQKTCQGRAAWVIKGHVSTGRAAWVQHCARVRLGQVRGAGSDYRPLGALQAKVQVSSEASWWAQGATIVTRFGGNLHCCAMQTPAAQWTKLSGQRSFWLITISWAHMPTKLSPDFFGKHRHFSYTKTV